MKQSRHIPFAAIALLLAGVALPLNPGLAQEATLVNAPPPVTAPAEPPVVDAAPPPTVSPAPQVQAPPQPAPAADMAQPPAPAAERSAASTPARRAPSATRPVPGPAPVAEAAPVPLVQSAPAPVDEVPMTPAPLPETVPAADLPEPTPEIREHSAVLWPWLVGLATAAAAVFAFLLLGRRRRARAARREARVVERTGAAASEPALSAPAALAAAVPLAAAAPLASAPPDAVEPERIERAAEAIASVEKVSISEPNAGDVEALAAASDAPGGRPWLEFLLRPIRAGTIRDDAVVEFELTVGNTGSIPAEDVRLSTWMFAAGSPAESEIEKMLIEPPARARLPELRIPAGEGARVEAALALSREGLKDSILPVVVAEARYTLPDGSEGRMSAAFEVGLPGDVALGPFPADRSSGLIDTVEARLHGNLERT